MAIRFHSRRLIQFADTDMAGIAHFTNYLRYLEEAEHEFLRAHGLSVVMHDDRGAYGFPKTSVHCDYRRPVRLEQWLDIELDIATPDGKAIVYEGRFRESDRLVAEGTIHVACCRFPADGGPPFPIPIPNHILKILGSELVA